MFFGSFFPVNKDIFCLNDKVLKYLYKAVVLSAIINYKVCDSCVESCVYLRAGITCLPLVVDREDSSCRFSLNTSTSLRLELVRAVPALQMLNRS